MTHCWETLLSKYMYSQYGQLIVQKKQRLYSRGQTILGDYLVKTTWQQVYMYLTQSRQNSHQCSADGLRCHWRLLSMLATFTMSCAAYRIHQRASSSTASLSCDAICYIHSMAVRDELHPTLGAVKQLIHRVQILDTLWGQAFASLSKSSWICCNMDSTGTQHDQVKPITVEVLPAPKAIIEMVRCLVVQNRLFFFPMLLQIKELNTHRHRAISAAPSVRAMRTLERTCCQMKVMIDDF